MDRIGTKNNINEKNNSIKLRFDLKINTGKNEIKIKKLVFFKFINSSSFT